MSLTMNDRIISKTVIRETIRREHLRKLLYDLILFQSKNFHHDLLISLILEKKNQMK